VTHYTTLKALRRHGACKSRYAYLTARLEGLSEEEAELEEEETCKGFRRSTFPDDRPIPLVRILDLNGLGNAIWALRANLHPQAEGYARLFACLCAEHVLRLWEAEFPDDARPRATIATAMRHAIGQATDEELAAAWAAAREAAGAAAGAAAGDAAGAAAGAAAREAAGDAAWAVAWAARIAAGAAAREAAWIAAGTAAWIAERRWQEEVFRSLFEEEATA
jgi:hypothetical protein